jgi:hypothetical protein
LGIPDAANRPEEIPPMPINNLPPVNTAAFMNTTATASATATTNGAQTGFTAQNTFGAGQANFAALGAPDQLGSSLQQLQQVIGALTEVVKALGSILTALKGEAPQNAQTTPPKTGEQAKTEGGGGTEAAKTEPGKEAGGGGTEAAKTGTGGTEPAKTGGTGGTQNAQTMQKDVMSVLTSLLQVLAALIEQIQGQQEEAKAADGKGKGKKGEAAKGGGHTPNASAKGKEHAAANSKVGQAAMMEKMNQAVTQILTALLQLLGPLLQQVAGQLGNNPEAAKAAEGMKTALAGLGGGALSGGVVMRS